MRIGLVINILNEEYQISVFKGIKKRTEELGINLICLQDENIRFEPSSFIGKFPEKSFFALDGVIILSSVLTENFGIQCKEDIKKLWGDIPVVSVGQKLEDVPSLLIQTDDSMKQLVEHLVLEHKYRKFVYLSGSQNHYDATKREVIFKETMEAYKPWFPDLNYIIKRGWFEERAAIEAMKDCFEEHPDLNPDVIVCANDNMAIGVYKFLKMNHENPNLKDCAVTGFDDIPQGRFVIPALTTIHQPLEEIGNAAVDSLVQLIKGGKVPEERYIESKIIYRNSCGCKNVENISAFGEEIQVNYVNSEEMLKLVSSVGQDLNYGETETGLKYIINANVEQMGIENFCVLSFPYHSNNNVLAGVGKLDVKPIYVRRNGVYYFNFQDNKESSLGDFYNNYLNVDNTPPKTLAFKFLNSGNEIIGCVLYDAPELVLPHIVTIAIDISQAMARIESFEERKKRSEYLEKEVSKRTQQLVESNNKRMKVEAEVLRISEVERQRFSTDLHDDICQRLAGISMLCRSYSNQENPVAKEQMVELAELISDTLQATRQYAHNSFPVELESLGMNHSVSNLCNSFEKQSGIVCEYDWRLKNDTMFNKMQKLNIFRIIQEALHNVMKHSQATKVCVTVRKSGKSVIVQIVDDGCGIDENKSGSNGIGLNSMQYRANQIGATFELKKNVPKGTCVEIKVLCDEE